MRARYLLLGLLALLALLAPGVLRDAGAAPGDDGELIVHTTASVRPTDLMILARVRGWTLDEPMARFPTRRAKTVWRVRRNPRGFSSSKDLLAISLRSNHAVRIVERNSRFGASSLPPGSGGYGGDQSSVPIFDDDLDFSVMMNQPAVMLAGVERARQVSMGFGTVVAVLDGGFNLAHEALAGRTIGGYDAITGDYDPMDFGNGLDDDGDGMVDEGVGHGTAVAGVVLATAPGTWVLPVRVLDDEGIGTALSLTMGLYYAMDAGAQVINVSLSGHERSAIVETALREAANRGILVVGTPGNGGSAQVNYPGSSPMVMPVAGVELSREADLLSNFGYEIDLSAPSRWVVAPYPLGPQAYGWWPGTSVAAPFVSGTAALMIQRNPGTPPTMLGQLILTALAPYGFLPPDRMGKYGGGILDAGMAVMR
jgi:subtilisin family serine protease